MYIFGFKDFTLLSIFLIDRNASMHKCMTMAYFWMNTSFTSSSHEIRYKTTNRPLLPSYNTPPPSPPAPPPPPPCPPPSLGNPPPAPPWSTTGKRETVERMKSDCFRRRNNPELEKRRTHHCDFASCNKVYTKSSHLKAHQRIHTGLNWFIIDESL